MYDFQRSDQAKWVDHSADTALWQWDRRPDNGWRIRRFHTQKIARVVQSHHAEGA